MNCSLVALDIRLLNAIWLQVTIINSYTYSIMYVITKTFVVICCSLSVNSTKLGCWMKEIEEVNNTAPTQQSLQFMLKYTNSTLYLT